MKPNQICAIQRCMGDLVRDLIPHSHTLEKGLLDAKIIPKELPQELNRERIKKILDCVIGHPDDVYEIFLKILNECGASACILLLQKEDRKPVSRIAQETGYASERVGWNLGQCMGSTYHPGWLNHRIYKHDSQPRGLVLIINNKEFANPTLTKRTGSEKDCERLEKLFSNVLGFKAMPVLQNLKSNEMLHEIKMFAARQEHAMSDSCVLVIMSHGCDGRIFGTDGKQTGNASSGWITVQEIVECFGSMKAPDLRGKPKLIIIQACRSPVTVMHTPMAFHGQASGGLGSPPCHPDARPDSDAVPTDLQESSLGVDFHQHADVVVANAACQGSVAFRTSSGSPFINHLTDTFAEKAHEEDLLTMFTDVNQRMRGESPKHMSSILYQLTYKWYLNPPSSLGNA